MRRIVVWAAAIVGPAIPVYLGAAFLWLDWFWPVLVSPEQRGTVLFFYVLFLTIVACALFSPESDQ